MAMTGATMDANSSCVFKTVNNVCKSNQNNKEKCQEALEERSCVCAVFSSQVPEVIIERALPYDVTCDSEGEDKCQQLCVAVAETAREKAPQMICEKLNTHVENLQVAVYAKVCNMPSWKFTGLKGLDPICCHEGKSLRCEQPASVV